MIKWIKSKLHKHVWYYKEGVKIRSYEDARNYRYCPVCGVWERWEKPYYKDEFRGWFPYEGELKWSETPANGFTPRIEKTWHEVPEVLRPVEEKAKEAYKSLDKRPWF